MGCALAITGGFCYTISDFVMQQFGLNYIEVFLVTCIMQITTSGLTMAIKAQRIILPLSGEWIFFASLLGMNFFTSIVSFLTILECAGKWQNNLLCKGIPFWPSSASTKAKVFLFLGVSISVFQSSRKCLNKKNYYFTVMFFGFQNGLHLLVIDADANGWRNHYFLHRSLFCLDFFPNFFEDSCEIVENVICHASFDGSHFGRQTSPIFSTHKLGYK